MAEQPAYVSRLKKEMIERATLFKKLVEAYGPGVLEIVEETVIEQTRHALAEASLARRDLKTVQEILWEQMGELAAYEVIEQTKSRLGIRVKQCLFAEEMRKQGAEGVGYAFYCCYDYGFCEGLNPKMRFRRTKTLMRGDECCDHTYEMEKD